MVPDSRCLCHKLQVAGDASRQTYEEAWPRVHAFNTLRVLFASQKLAIDASRHRASCFAAAVEALSAPHWEVMLGGSCFS